MQMEDQPRMNIQQLAECATNDDYYETPELNTCLCLNNSGYNRIENMDKFSNLRCLMLEGNCIKEISGLEKCTKLRCLLGETVQMVDDRGASGICKTTVFLGLVG
eukprot:GHVN01105739.1.p1 GENE.GHVN01105739.1~~GHVN01105739.1.p1  ORF type:complete len:105 (+),score=9.25 GHVN01105739.1:153-467(+)